MARSPRGKTRTQHSEVTTIGTRAGSSSRWTRGSPWARTRSRTSYRNQLAHAWESGCVHLWEQLWGSSVFGRSEGSGKRSLLRPEPAALCSDLNDIGARGTTGRQNSAPSPHRVLVTPEADSGQFRATPACGVRSHSPPPPSCWPPSNCPPDIPNTWCDSFCRAIVATASCRTYFCSTWGQQCPHLVQQHALLCFHWVRARAQSTGSSTPFCGGGCASCQAALLRCHRAWLGMANLRSMDPGGVLRHFCAWLLVYSRAGAACARQFLRFTWPCLGADAVGFREVVHQASVSPLACCRLLCRRCPNCRR